MLLRHIYMYLNPEEFSLELGSEFDFRARYLCNFIERRLRQLRFHTADFSTICVQGQHVPDESCPIRHVNAAVASFAFDEQQYKALGPSDHHEYFIHILQGGFEKCARYHSIPRELLNAIDDFRRIGYKNEWTHQSKLLRPAGIRASLLCSLDTNRFVLTLRLESKGHVLFEKPILETKPDEIIFAHQFKEVALDGQTVTVRDKFGKPTFSINLNSLI